MLQKVGTKVGCVKSTWLTCSLGPIYNPLLITQVNTGLRLNARIITYYNGYSLILIIYYIILNGKINIILLQYNENI